jgi:RimJ/RimL family protein N-acetyltransferase
MTEVAIRPVENADIEVFFDQQLDPDASAMAAFPSRERDAFFVHWTDKILTNRRGLARTIVADGAVAGHIVSWISDDTQQRMLGYWLGKDFWGRGVASEALRLYLAELADRPVYADVAMHNVGSQRVLEKNGFIRIWDEPHVADDGVELMMYRLD